MKEVSWCGYVGVFGFWQWQSAAGAQAKVLATGVPCIRTRTGAGTWPLSLAHAHQRPAVLHGVVPQTSFLAAPKPAYSLQQSGHQGEKPAPVGPHGSSRAVEAYDAEHSYCIGIDIFNGLFRWAGPDKCSGHSRCDGRDQPCLHGGGAFGGNARAVRLRSGCGQQRVERL